MCVSCCCAPNPGGGRGIIALTRRSISEESGRIRIWALHAASAPFFLRMKIVIVGAGEVGRYLSQILSERGDDVTVIESSEAIANEMDEEQDVRVIVGNGASAKFLEKAGVQDAGFFLAMTAHDQLNIVACSLASKMGAKYTVARIHDQVYSDNSIINYQEHFNIDFLLNPEALCAVEFAKMIRNPERVAVEDFARGEIEVQRVELDAGAKILGRPLRDIKFPKNMRVGYVQRGGKMIVAGADTSFMLGDVLTVMGSPEALFESRQLFSARRAENDVVVVIYGATEISISLVRLLSNPRFRVRVIEPSLALCRRMAERFPHITVINGSATSLKLLEEEEVGGADYFVACTRDDEENIMTCLQAKKLGVRHVQLTINKPDYEAVLGNMVDVMGLDLVVSPRRTTAVEIMRYISADRFVKVGKLDNEDVEIIEVRVSPSSPCAGKALREARLPQGCIIAAHMHRNITKVPGADDVINAGDRLIIILSRERTGEVAGMLGGHQ